MSSPRPLTPRRARPVFNGPTYMAPRYHSRLWGRLIFLAFVVLLLGLIGVGGGLYWELHRAQGGSSRDLVFTVTAGDSVNTVADRLQREGLIDHSLIFKLDARIQSLSGKLKPGDYTLRRNMSIDQMVAALAVYKPIYARVTVPEGFRFEQVALVLKQDGIDPKSFLAEARHPNPAYLHASILKDKPANASLEGYLSPNTYLVQPHSSGRDFARLMVQQRDQEFTLAMRASLRARKLSVYDALILASIVEREARLASDRPKVASVYLNRLQMGMPLDADPTVQYALATDQHSKRLGGKWWPVLQDQAANIEPQSPYNTYVNKGLPPGPIANPGLASIRAVIYPANTNYLYFLSIPHSGGKLVFATTLQEQTANEQKYGYPTG